MSRWVGSDQVGCLAGYRPAGFPGSASLKAAHGMPNQSARTTNFTIRLPNELRRRLEREAAKRAISVAALILERLEAEDHPGKPDARGTEKRA